MTDKELADAAWAELAQTTITYGKWKGQRFTPGHWANAKGLLDQVGAAPTPAPAAAPVPYVFDATKATVAADQSPAQYMQTHRFSNGLAVLGAEVPVVVAPAGTPKVHVTGTYYSADVPLPPNYQVGPTPDKHACIIDAADGTVYAAEQLNPATLHASNVGVVPPGGVSEIGAGDSNAASMNLANCLTVEDVLGWNLKTLALGIPTTAEPGTKSLWPADTTFNDPRCLYGQWVRLDPSKTPPTYPNRLLAYIDACLRKCGGMLRDQADGLTVYAKSYANEGGNPAAYAKVGVTLYQPPDATYPMGYYLPGVPWEQLQALNPPPH